MAFKKRTVAPTADDKWWKTSFNPCIAISYGTVLPNCVGYAWGRFAEILGKFADGLPRCNAGDWYGADTTHQKGKTPKLGAVLVMSKPGDAGHVAVVEEIYSDGSILTSESGYGNSWSNRWWTSKRTPPNYCNSPYQFVGFIYNPAVSGNESSEVVDISDPSHPAQRFVQEAISHVGANGHAWVQSNTSIGNQAWCAATMCAVAKACGFAGVIMPEAEYTAAGFGRAIIETYGGQYFAGPVNGSNFTPQIGDIIEYTKKGENSYYAGTRYAAYHVGCVRGVEGSTVLTVEGNTDGGQYKLKEKQIDGSNIGWYARPDWTKVGGSALVTGGMLYGGELYTTESTRADASLREVGYLTKAGQPSIKSSGVRLAVINYTGLLADFVKVYGGSSDSSASGSPDNVDGLPAVPREIVQYLVGKGLNTAAAIGVIANIKAESGFDTGAVEKGPPYEGRGLCQWSFGRRTKMIEFVGPNWATNLTGQLDFLWYELSGSYKSSVLSPLQEVPNNLEGAKKAADIFVRHFEIPGGVEQATLTRQKYAEEFWNMVVVSESETSAAQGVITKKDGTKLTSGTAVKIPSSVPQTGIVANFTSYTQFYDRWSRNTVQRQLADIWGQQGKPHSHCVATLSGYYLVAVTLKFGTTGDIISVVFEDGTYFNAIIGDSKGADAGSEWGHYLGNQIDIIEWEAWGTDQSALRSGLQEAGFLGKRVAKIVNYGPWL